MQDDYIKARKLGQKQYRKDVSSGRYPYIPSLEFLVDHVNKLTEVPVGLVEIPLSMIMGTRTSGRQQAFATNFMPILEPNSEFANKWSALYDSQIVEGIREPIKVYEYLHRFYVQEGNKRVSVSKFVDSYSILGNVTRIMPSNMEDESMRVYSEFLQFYESASLYEIDLSYPGGYQKMADVFSLELGKPWPIELVEKLKGSFQLFEKMYVGKAEGRISISSSDAFLTYLTIYGIEHMQGISRTLLSKRIDKIWSEIMIQQGDDQIALVKDPDEEAPGTSQQPSGGIMKTLFGPQYSASHPLKCAFCYERPASNSSWIYGHELGRSALDSIFNGQVETVKYDDCSSDEKLREAIDSACADGNEMIFTISPKQMEETLRSAIHYPKVHFLNCSINLSHPKVRTYYGRMYEAKALMGALAASLSKGMDVGYVADYPIYGTVAEINAFAIGAAMINPDVKVHLSWSSMKDRDWHDDMKKAGVSVISGQDFIKPDSASREYGLFRINQDGSIANLATPVWNWGKYYELIIRSVLEGRWEESPDDVAVNYWWGMSAGVIDVILSEHLPYYSYKLVQSLRNATVKDTLNPFSGEIHDQSGKTLKGYYSGLLDSRDIITMDWLNDNVIGSLPRLDELTEAGVETVRVSGILGTENN